MIWLYSLSAHRTRIFLIHTKYVREMHLRFCRFSVVFPKKISTHTHSYARTEPNKETENSQPHDNPCVNWHKELVRENWLATAGGSTAAWWFSAITVDNDEDDGRRRRPRRCFCIYLFFFFLCVLCFSSSMSFCERLLLMAHFMHESNSIVIVSRWRIEGNSTIRNID